MPCECGSFECTCQGRCLCTREDCPCERCEDLRSGRTLKYLGNECVHDQSWDKDTHGELRVFSENLKATKDVRSEKLPLNSSLQEPHSEHKEAKSNISEKSFGVKCESFSSQFSPQSPAKYNPNSSTLPKRSFSSPEEIFKKFIGSIKYEDHKGILVKASDSVSPDIEEHSPVKKSKFNHPSSTRISADKDPSPKAQDQFLSKRNERVGEDSLQNPNMEKLQSHHITPDSSLNEFHLPDINAMALSPGRKYAAMVTGNILSPSNKPSRVCPASATESLSNDDSFLRHLPQFHSTPQSAKSKYIPIFDSSRNQISGVSEDNLTISQHKSSDASECTLEPMESDGCQHDSSDCKSSTVHVTYKRCMPIISIPGEGNFAWQGPQQKSSSLDSYFDRIRPCPALRVTGYEEDIQRMSRCVQEFVLPLEEFTEKICQQHAPLAAELSERDSRLIAADSERSSSKVKPQNAELPKEMGAEVPTITTGFIQGDPEIDDPFILKGLPYDITSDESHLSESTPDNETQ